MDKHKFIHSILVPLNIIIGCYMIFFLSTFLMMNLFVFSKDSIKYNYLMILQVSIPMLIFLIFLPLIIEKYIFKNNFESMGFKIYGYSKRLSKIIYIIFTLLFLKLCINEDNNAYLISLLVIVFIQCLGEDVLFRIVLQKRLHDNFNPFTVITLVSILFVFIFHKDNFLENLIYRFPLGIIMSYVFYKTRNVFSVTAIHVINNLYDILN